MFPQKRELQRFPRPSATSQASFPPISGQKKCGWTPLTCLQDGVNEDAGLPRQGRPTKNLRVFKGSNRFGCPNIPNIYKKQHVFVFPRNLNILFSMFKHPINHVFNSMAISATSNDERFVHLGRSCLLLAGRPHFQGLLLRQTSGRSSCARIFCCPEVLGLTLKLRPSAYQVSTMSFVPNIGVGFSFSPKKSGCSTQNLESHLQFIEPRDSPCPSTLRQHQGVQFGLEAVRKNTQHENLQR